MIIQCEMELSEFSTTHTILTLENYVSEMNAKPQLLSLQEYDFGGSIMFFLQRGHTPITSPPLFDVILLSSTFLSYFSTVGVIWQCVVGFDGTFNENNYTAKRLLTRFCVFAAFLFIYCRDYSVISTAFPSGSATLLSKYPSPVNLAGRFIR